MGLLGIVAGDFAIFAAIYSKTSFAITLLRISEGRTRILLWFIIISVNIALGGSALIPWIQCRPVEKNWNVIVPGKCWNLKIFSYYGMAGSAYSGAMDILLAFIPWKMFWNLQMKEKIGVATAMSMGVFAGAAAITKSVYNPLVASGDFSCKSLLSTLLGFLNTYFSPLYRRRRKVGPMGPNRVRDLHHRRIDPRAARPNLRTRS